MAGINQFSKAQDTLLNAHSLPENIQRAMFPGGDGAMYAYINENVQIPEIALEYGISGTVVASILIDTNGLVSKVSILKALGFGCDEEVLRVLKTLPALQAAKDTITHRKFVQEIVIPVKFKSGKTIDNTYFNLKNVTTPPEIKTEKGQLSFEEYIRSKIVFPEGEKRKPTPVQMMVKVDKNGNVKFEISNTVAPAFQQAIAEVISTLPSVIPATFQQSNVNCQFFMEVYFYPDKK